MCGWLGQCRRDGRTALPRRIWLEAQAAALTVALEGRPPAWTCPLSHEVNSLDKDALSPWRGVHAAQTQPSTESPQGARPAVLEGWKLTPSV